MASNAQIHGFEARRAADLGQPTLWGYTDRRREHSASERQGPMILAIDPGTYRSGWVVYRDGRVLECGTSPNLEVLTWLDKGAYAVLAIEMIEHYGQGMPAGASVFDTCIWIGRFVQAWPQPHNVWLIPRRDVKLQLCGSSRAKDPNVRQALIDRLGPKGTKRAPGPTYGVSGHVWAALGVAVVCADSLQVA